MISISFEGKYSSSSNMPSNKENIMNKSIILFDNIRNVNFQGNEESKNQ